MKKDEAKKKTRMNSRRPVSPRWKLEGSYQGWASLGCVAVGGAGGLKVRAVPSAVQEDSVLVPN